MFVAVVGRHRAEDHANLLEAPLVGRQQPTRNAGGVASLSRLGVAPIDRPVGIECRAQRDVEQAALAACIDGWHASNRLPQLTRCRDDAQAAGLLCDQQVAAGERLHGPRVLESLREHADIEGDVRLDRAMRYSFCIFANAARISNAVCSSLNPMTTKSLMVLSFA